MENYLTYNWQTKTSIIPIAQTSFKEKHVFAQTHFHQKTKNKKKQANVIIMSSNLISWLDFLKRWQVKVEEATGMLAPKTVTAVSTVVFFVSGIPRRKQMS